MEKAFVLLISSLSLSFSFSALRWLRSLRRGGIVGAVLPKALLGFVVVVVFVVVAVVFVLLLSIIIIITTTTIVIIIADSLKVF